MDDILDFEESKARITAWGHHYFTPGSPDTDPNLHMNLNFIDPDDPMDSDEKNIEIRPRTCVCGLSRINTSNLPTDHLQKNLPDLSHHIQNALLLLQVARVKFDHAIQESHFTIQAYERLAALHHDNNDRFLWTNEKKGRFDWGTADCNSKGGMDAGRDTCSSDSDKDGDGSNKDDEASDSANSVQIFKVADDPNFIDLTRLL